MKSYKKIILFACFSVFSSTYAQQSLPFFQEYIIGDKVVVNPSYTGATDDWVLQGSYNKYWSNFEGGPNTQTFLTHANVFDRVGIGMYLFRDENGPVSLNGVNISAAYHIPLSDEEDRNERFSFGPSLSLFNQHYDASKINPLDRDDPTLAEENLNIFLPYLNLGMSFGYKKLFGGVSILDIPIGNNRAIVNTVEPLPTIYFFNLGYNWILQENIAIEPSVMMNLNSNSSRIIDSNIRAKYFNDTNEFALGLSYRQDLDKNGSQALTASPFVQAKINRLNFGLSYNIGLSDIATLGGNGFLISLGYNMENIFNPNGFRYR